jgi:toxin FitB
MIVLDTNVVSDLMRVRPEPILVEWIRRQPVASVWTTVVTVLELRFGIELLPQSKRRAQLETALERNLHEDLGARILDFDRSAAHEAAVLAAQRQRAGLPMEFRDAEIAGIVASRRATLATRNIRHFENLGIELVNPWTEV